MELYNHDLKSMVSKQCITKLIILTWQQALIAWHICNNHLHPTTPQDADCIQLQTQVQQILHEVQQDPNLKAIIGTLTIDKIMSNPTKQIHQFI